MALSKVNPNLITQGPSGRKNLIINGAMQVAQRGIESTNTNGGYKTMDRWNMFDNLGKINHYQSTEGPAGFNNSYKWVVHTTATAGTSSIVAPNQSIEGFNSAHLEWGTSDAKSVTVSFWCKTSVTGSYGLWIRNGAANRYYNTMCTISNANTWTYITKTIPGDTSGTWIGATSGNGLTVGICLDAGSGVQGTADQWSGNTTYSTTANAAWQASSGATFFLTGFQLELGSVATDFEHRSYDESLLACQRYYENIAKPTAADDSPYFGIGHGVKSDQINWFYDFKAEKRAPITLIVNTVTNGYYGKNHSTEKNKETLGITMGHQSLHSIMGYMTGITGVTEQSAYTMQCNGAGCLIAASAEL